MSSRPSWNWLVATFLAALILTFGPDAQAASESANLSDLPPAAQAQISAALGREHSSYHAVARGGGFRAANPKHSLVADFAPSGVKVSVGTATWSLALRGYGYGEALQAVSAVAPQAMANRVEYQRGALTEWYLNGPLGLEQGFTIARPPAGEPAEPLTLALTFSGPLTPSVDSDGKDVVLSRADGTPVLAYRGLTAYDATGRELRAWVQISGGALRLRVDDAGAQYPLVVDPFVQQAKLTASAGAAVTGLGVSVAVSGDTIVVGATSDFSVSQRGSAHVFVRPAGGWSGALIESAKLTVSGGTETDGFGESVAVSGDVIVVGAPGAAPDLTGAAYVFVKPVGGWTSTPTPSATLTASDAAPQGVFGRLVAVDGDTIVVSPDASAGQRTVYVFVKPVGGWSDATQNAKLTPDVAASDFFGGSLAVGGDTIVVGAPGFPTDRLPGSAYVFVKPVGGWTDTDKPNARLSAFDPVDNGGLGTSVGVRADTIAVVGFANPSTGQGSVTYTFVKPAAGWSDKTESARLVASDGAIFESVAVRGDLIVAGAPSAGTPSARGTAYVFVRPSGGWSGPLPLPPTLPPTLNEAEKLLGDAVSLDLFGSSIAVSDDTVVVGAPSLFGQGSAYVFGNNTTIANAGPDQTADDGALVVLDGSASSGGGSLTFSWMQLPGPVDLLDDASSPTPRFTAPFLSAGVGSQTLTFQLTVTSTGGSSTDTVDVTVRNVNHAPVADAGGDQVVNEGSPVTLSGELSFDNDSDPLSFLWTQTSGTPVVLSGADTAHPTFTAPVLPGSTGSVSILTFALTVSDGVLTSTAETRVTVEQVNHLPVADDGVDQTVAAGALVGLNASGSFDPDGDPITYSWTQTGGPTVVLSDPNTANPSFVAPQVAGATMLSFRVSVSDGTLTSVSDGVAITVTTPNDPPLCHLAHAWPPILWPPIHQMVPIKIWGVADPDHDRVVIKVVSVTQDEPVKGVTYGDTSPDAVILSKGVLVRAERADKGNGRVYQINFRADDGHGGTCNGSVKVKVPRFWTHPIDDGQNYDSTKP
jgi:FG-GAP repeat